MASDISRKTFNPKKHYSAVIKQQGRVDVDADWNEQQDINQYRELTETRDVIGASGVPKKGNSFKIKPNVAGGDVTISPGHMYVGGLLCELDSDQPVSYFNQPWYPNPDTSAFDMPASPPASPPGSPPASPPEVKIKDGTYLAYIDAWQREISYLDDHLIQEVALGEADTATRLQNVWQVRLVPIKNSNATCKSNIAEWNKVVTDPTGKLNARANATSDPGDPCELPPGTGYRRLENQLYRVEVHKGGDLSKTTFKWSRDNASVETKIKSISGSVITVEDFGKDENLGFISGQWVEIVSEESTLNADPADLLQILDLNPDTKEITLSSAVTSSSTGPLKLRRWDQSVAEADKDGLKASSDWIDIEGGVQVIFSPGTYRAGDYWLIPARIATGDIEWPPYEIPNLSPVEQPPQGVEHFYCRLALFTISDGALTDWQDCRPLFPALTEICAEDICFDNKNCDFPDVKNVQEALDILCAVNDIRDHNKYLHGSGVVCGLKIKCRVTRDGVIIEKGVALDCDGYMIQIKKQNGMPYDLVANAKEKKLLDDNGSGMLTLAISRSTEGHPKVTVEKYVPQGFWDNVLEGTLLKDFYDDCIKVLIDFFKEQFPFPVKDEVPVPVGQRRITAFINLLYQAVNPTSGPYGFISGNSSGDGNNSSVTEDKLLRAFYNDLKEMLASETFCAMFDNDDPYPDYILDEGLDTIFGTSFRLHHKIRLHPNGKTAYTASASNRIGVYDLTKKELIQSSEFFADPNIKLQDIVISEKDNKIVAVGILNDKDSVFATGKLNNKGLIDWKGTSFASGLKFISLAATKSGDVFSTARSQGFYLVSGIGTASFSTAQLLSFNATGLMIMPDAGHQVVAAASNNAVGTETTQFDKILVFNSFDNNNPIFTVQLQGNDAENDIISAGNLVLATGKNPTGLRALDAFSMNSNTGQVVETTINSNSILRLGFYTSPEKQDYVLVSVADQLKVIRVLLQNGELQVDDKFRIPVQPYPVGIVMNDRTRTGYVLNTFVNTLTEMDMVKVFFDKPAPDYTHEPPINLAIYRDQAIEAYKDVLSHILQYLKDCFCDKFLIDCPDCGEDEKVYLGSVEVRNLQVYNICNFSKRKYVKTFPTVEYWLSTVPVFPVIKQAFTALCCTVPDLKAGAKSGN